MTPEAVLGFAALADCTKERQIAGMSAEDFYSALNDRPAIKRSWDSSSANGRSTLTWRI
jgi:hypothetical protein